ncbi:MAG: heterodisulfide reductase-related iron-sulfur binding cluster, partial [Chlorobi bacterium]|nr:heterodisulfide reductase-related iron-sulfur binding cluster [Chlorobiota bacterium]
SVGAARRTGTALINEDVAFPRERLADAVRDLQLLLAAHRFDDAVVFGHARDGNMHFAFSLDSDGSSIERYGQFMERLAELVVERYDGSLKAEHSTGRNMAPFLEHQWGGRVVDLMRHVKQLLDPEGLLNPDVIFTQDRRIHLHNIKQLPPVSSHVDRCIECGFCERVCPSSELTLSPRQRIIVQREIVRHSRDCIARRLERDYVYAGMETCATDGLCMVTCPVGINSGDLTIAQRSQSKRMLERVYWQIAASRVRGWIRGIGIALSVARGASNVLGERVVHCTTERLARLFRIPSWLPAMGIPEHFSVTSLPEADVLYVPSCMACFGGRSPHGHSIVSSLLRIAERAGISVAVTRTAGTVCCGHPWHSYGYEHQYRHVLDQWVEAVFCESDGGRVPIVIDSSSCQLSLRVAREHSGKTGQMLAALRILGPVEFAELIVERLGIVGQSVSLIVHPACSLRRLDGGVESLVQVLQRSRCTVELPHSAWCCGMAGDRGLRYPELPAHALDVAIKEIAALDADMVVSTNLPCQWQLSHRIGKPVISLWEALDLLYQ